jgi:hypothetical protein
MNKDLRVCIALMLVLSVVLIATVKLMFFGFVGLFVVLISSVIMIADERGQW